MEQLVTKRTTRISSEAGGGAHYHQEVQVEGRSRAESAVSLLFNDGVGEGRKLCLLEDLAPTEMRNSVHAWLLHRVCQMTGVKMSQRFTNVIQDKGRVAGAYASDVESIEPRQKSSNIATIARAMAVWQSGQPELALPLFEIALNGPLVSGQLMCKLAACTAECDPCDTRIEPLFLQAISLAPLDPEIRFQYASWLQKTRKEEARLMWLRTLNDVKPAEAATSCKGYIACLRQMQLHAQAMEVEHALSLYNQKK